LPSVSEPRTADEAAAILAAASRDNLRVAIRGGGTKSDWRPPVPAPDVVLSTLGLNRVIAHRHGDLTATIEAGARLDDVNRELARHRQWIPLDPPWSDRATIGGIVATNTAGPRRHRYGAPRDLIIGVDIVRADGVRAKAGGIVVKNVAGYDLSRLMTGSFGSLALVTSATFKLYPMAAASRTVIAEPPSHAAAGALVSAINASQLTPTAVEVQAPALRVLIRFESTTASVGAQSAAVIAMAAAHQCEVSAQDGEVEARTWRDHAEWPWRVAGAVIKLTLLPSDLAPLLDAVERTADGAKFQLAGSAGVGALMVGLEGDAASHQRAIAALQSHLLPGTGSVVVLRGDEALKMPAANQPARSLMTAVRSTFDPSGVLANRGVE
jgi:glycolate oxidase FAD binding subunit